MAQHPARDRYANIATIEVTQSAANVITFAELQTNAGIESDRKSATAIAIDQIDYFPARAMIAEMTATGDFFAAAITVSNTVANIELVNDARILHSMGLAKLEASAVGSNFIATPITKQFFPALITAERRLYIGLDSGGLASANVMRTRIYYRTVHISPEEFVELAEVFRLVG